MALLWVLGVDVPAGMLFLAGPGGRFDFPMSEAPHIAAALADHATDPDDAEFAADEWAGAAETLHEEEEEEASDAG